jgi:HMG box factor
MSTTQQRHPLPSSSSPQNNNTNNTNINDNKNNTITATTATTATAAQTTPRLPIALLPSGFSLTLADRFACAVPIADAYAPVDHWQWMATLWRGVVGADLVVYVPSSSPSSSTSSPFGYLTGSSSFVGGGMGEEGVAVMGPGMVEVKSAGLIVVKAPVVVSGAANGSVYEERERERERDGVEVVVDEKIERRLGFEVVEWVRGGGWLYATEY